MRAEDEPGSAVDVDGVDAAAVVDGALRAALRSDDELRELRLVADALPALVAHVGPDCRYRYVNRAFEEWLGVPRSALVGRSVEDVLGPAAWEQVSPRVARALRGERITYDVLIDVPGHLPRWNESRYIPVAGGGFVVLAIDASGRKLEERSQQRAAARSQRLMKITAAVAGAVTEEQVYEAIVDRTAAALDADAAALWRVDNGVARCVRGGGVDSSVVDAVVAGEARFVSGAGGVPVVVNGVVVGALVVARGDDEFDDEDRDLLALVARYAGQALERRRLLEENERGRVRAELLYGLARAVIGAHSRDAVFDAALAAIAAAMGTPRAAILTFDGDEIMRFRAWRGLSDAYRAAVDGHSPWTRDTVDPRPVLVRDVDADDAWAGFRDVFAAESIRALAFIPLVAEGRLLGKFMVYFDRPGGLDEGGKDVCGAIANHVAAAIARFAAIEALERTVRFNELFVGVLGHDLRTPLQSVNAGAELLLDHEDELVLRTAARLRKSGLRMSRMIDQLLDFTRVRVGRGIALSRTRFDLLTLVREIIDELQAAHGDVVITLDHSGKSDGEFDADRLSQALSNLVGNAVHHGHHEDGVKVVVVGKDDAVDVVIENGGSVPADLRPRLFEPLAGGVRRRDGSQGLGLGLFITHEIVTAHGGAIAVDSDDKRTRFCVTLPRS